MEIFTEGILFGVGATTLVLGGVIVYLISRIKQYEDDSGENLLARLKKMAKDCKIDIHGNEYQTFMNRMFMDVAGRHSSAAKAYSETVFMKDTPEEIMARAAKLKQQSSAITSRNAPAELDYDEDSIDITPKKRKRR